MPRGQASFTTIRTIAMSPRLPDALHEGPVCLEGVGGEALEAKARSSPSEEALVP
jgi:hypothetical protein